MKIAIASSGQKLSSLVDQRFGRCPFYLIVDSKDKSFRILKNIATQASRGVGISAAQLIADQGVKTVIAGNFGPNAVRVLLASHLKLFSISPKTTIRQAVNQLKQGKLTPVILDNAFKNRP